MPKGTPLTPEQQETLAGMYAECGNARAVARAMKLSPSTVTRQLATLGEQQRATLQREALLTGLVDGRERIERAVRGVSRHLWRELKRIPPASPTPASALFNTDAQTVQQLGTTLARLVSVLATLDRREEQRLGAQLLREKTRAEITALQRRVEEIPPLEVLRAKLSPAQIVELVRGLTEEQLSAATALTEPKEEIPAKDG